MHLLTLWRDSLAVLKPKNVKLFSLVTLNSMVQTARVWVYYCWPWVGLALFEQYRTISKGYAPFGYVGLSGLVCALLILCARPSVHQKTYEYFKEHFWYPIIIMVVWTVLSCIAISIGPFALYPFLILPILYGLFLCDTSLTITDSVMSFGRALKMFWYNLPIFLLVTVIAHGLYHLVELCQHMSTSLWYIIAVFILLRMPFLLATVCFVTNIYVKKIHEQLPLYFTVKG